MQGRGPHHLGTYLKAAFANRWNLLALLGAAGFALLSGKPDVFLPLVMAGELLYLGSMAGHPRFRAAVEAQAAAAAREPASTTAEQTLQRILKTLPPQTLQRFEALRNRCMELRQLAAEIRDPSRAGSPLSLEQLQLAGLDRLLWIYLRLLFTEHSLSRFQHKTGRDSIRRDIEGMESRLAAAEKIADESRREKVVRALEDSLETSRQRLANLDKAAENHQLIQLEIERLETKIQALSEIAVNRHEPDFITSQVDQVAGSMMQTERTMNELQFATGLETADDAVPELVRRGTVAQGG